MNFKNSNKLEITEDKLELFVSQLTKQKINDFADECKKRHLMNRNKETENKISFQVFSEIMKNIMCGDKNEEFFLIEPILERIFNRFKSVKCMINTEGGGEQKEDKHNNQQSLIKQSPGIGKLRY